MGLLLIDIGRGTQDILLFRPNQAWENCIQLILPSPTVILAGAVADASAAGRDILFTGETMGGGPLTKAVRRHLEGGGRVWATPASAATFDDDPDKVRNLGIDIVGEEEVDSLRCRRGVGTIRTGDVDVEALESSLERWGLTFRVTAAAVAVQDHGRPPRGVSDRRFRFGKFREGLRDSADLKSLSYGAHDLPEYLTRMQGVRRSLEGRGPLLFMDTGFAAILGAFADPGVAGGARKLLLNIGNGHTLAGIVEGERLTGLFEHHTALLDASRLSGWLDSLVEGEIDDGLVYEEGGHGAYLEEGASFPGWEGIDVFAATGPRRSLTGGLERRPYLAAPHGQMMLTGNCGLYRAWTASRGEYRDG